MFEIIQ